MSEVVAQAELLEDRGEAALDEASFFRSRPFLDAEGVTHTLRIAAPGLGPDGSDLDLVAPLIVREIGPGPERDAISPYGYPGLVPTPRSAVPFAPEGSKANHGTLVGFGSNQGMAVDPAEVDFSATGLVSVFLRHALGPSPLAAATERNVVQIADPALPAKSRPSDRRQVRRNLEAGYALELVPGAETTAAQRGGFNDLYEQTMRRTGAAPHYFFGRAYFDRALEAGRTWLALATEPGGALAAASLAVVSDGHLHYHLSGSADAHLADSPMKNVVARLVELAGPPDLPLNLGGGLRRGDALEEFKRGFANREQAWLTSELVCDTAAYGRLSAGHDAGGFFPAYRR